MSKLHDMKKNVSTEDPTASDLDAAGAALDAYECEACAWRIQEWEGCWHCEKPEGYTCPVGGP